MADAGTSLTPTCGALTRDGGPCPQPAGFKTNHLGKGKCYLHGGLTPVQHGRYSSIEQERIGELIQRFEADPDPLNILPELAAGRALFVDFIERYGDMRDALLAWHMSFIMENAKLPEVKLMAFERVIDEWEDHVKQIDATDLQLADIGTAREFVKHLRERKEKDPKPREIVDIADAYRILETITKIVERIEKIRAQNAISRQDFLRLVEQMGVVVMKNVDDPVVLKRIRDEWLTIAVAPR